MKGNEEEGERGIISHGPSYCHTAQRRQRASAIRNQRRADSANLQFLSAVSGWVSWMWWSQRSHSDKHTRSLHSHKTTITTWILLYHAMNPSLGMCVWDRLSNFATVFAWSLYMSGQTVYCNSALHRLSPINLSQSYSRLSYSHAYLQTDTHTHSLTYTDTHTAHGEWGPHLMRNILALISSIPAGRDKCPQYCPLSHHVQDEK